MLWVIPHPGAHLLHEDSVPPVRLAIRRAPANPLFSAVAARLPIAPVAP